MKKPKELLIQDYKYQSKSMVKGYYYFEIKITYDNDLIDVIKKRYSHIKKLYKTLLLKCPGCLIPKLPNKTFIMKHIHMTNEEKSEIKEKIEKFLIYIINHPILKECKYVLNFFSNENKSIKRNQTLNTKNMKLLDDDDEEEDDNDDLESSSIDNEKINKSDNIKKVGLKKEIEIDDFEVIEKDDYTDLFKEENENELLNLFLEEENNKNKGLVSKSKDILITTYNYLKNYSEETTNGSEMNKNQGQISSETSIILSGSNFQEKDFDFIKSNFNELGEDMSINDYGQEIMRIQEGVEYLIKNFENEVNINEKKTNSLDNILTIFNEMKNLDNNLNKKNNDKKKEDDDKDDFILKNEDEDENKEIDKNNNKEDWEIKLLNNDINKIKNFSIINKKYIKDDLRSTIDEMIEYKTTIEGLKDIFGRKKNHIQFLLKLQSQLSENEKRNELTENNDSKKQIIKDINFIKKIIEEEKLFINKLNKNLKYEIDKFKKEQENNIYIFINNLFKNDYLKKIEIYNIINKEISFDIDLENSSTIKGETVNSDSENEQIDNKEDKNENKSRKLSGDDF